MDGWIKLHRQLLENTIVWQINEPFDKRSAWIYLLLMANYEDKKILLGNDIVVVKKGSFITSELKLAQRWKWSKTKVRAFLKLLETDEMIIKKSDHKKTTITIVNYSDYQTFKTIKEPVKDHEKTTEKPVGIHRQEIKNTRTKEENTMCKSETAQANELFEKLWKLYPVKKGKGQVSDAAKKRLLAIGYEELERAIDRYKQELEKDSDWRKPQNGSTFFNSGYVDYLDSNYVPSEHRADKRKKNGFNDFTQRKYDEQELENFFIEEVSRMKGVDDG